MSAIDYLTLKVKRFRDERDWSRFHTPKNLAQAMAAEVGELNHLYLWDSEPELKYVADEIADIFIFLLNLVDVLNLDLEMITFDKIVKNGVKYPAIKRSGKWLR